jgi:hypothetical protein
MTSIQGNRDVDLIRQLRRWGRAQSDPSIRSRYRIIEHIFARMAREPENGTLPSLLGRSVADLEAFIRSFPHLITPAPAARKPRPRTKSKPIGNPAGVCDWIAINALVPRGMPDRDEVQQDAYLAMLDGTAPDRKTAVGKAIKAYNHDHNKWRDSSIYAPARGFDGPTHLETIVAEDPRTEIEERNDE